MTVDESIRPCDHGCHREFVVVIVCSACGEGVRGAAAGGRARQSMGHFAVLIAAKVDAGTVERFSRKTIAVAALNAGTINNAIGTRCLP